MLTVDASILLKLFLPEADSNQAEALVQRHSPIIAPDIATFEITQAITQRFRNQEFSEDLARKKLAEWQRFCGLGLVKLAPTEPLLPAATELSIALKQPLTACLYLALAAERQSLLVTADAGLVEVATAAGHQIRLLRDCPL